MKLNLGYACINETLKRSDNIYVNRTCIQKTFETKGKRYAIELATKNLEDLIKIIKWNHNHSINFYRMSSAMFPQITNTNLMLSQSSPSLVYSLDKFNYLFQRIGELADRYDIRLTFHPDHYNQIGSPKLNVLTNTINDLSCHANIIDYINQYRYTQINNNNNNNNSVMVVHIGGTYGDKNKTIIRFQEQFRILQENVKDKIVIENCERNYCVEDLIPISDNLNIPIVLDFHHYNCYSKLHNNNPKQKSLEEIIPIILNSWDRRNLIPKFHQSEQALNKRIGAHSDYVEEIPQILFDITRERRIDLMIEAKAKENAVLKLKIKYDL
jgi:UV DNA damage endonuclease